MGLGSWKTKQWKHSQNLARWKWPFFMLQNRIVTFSVAFLRCIKAGNRLLKEKRIGGQLADSGQHHLCQRSHGPFSLLEALKSCARCWSRAQAKARMGGWQFEKGPDLYLLPGSRLLPRRVHRHRPVDKIRMPRHHDLTHDHLWGS